MGTRCLTVFTNNDGKEICRMYRQYDGYPEGHGVELGKFLAGIKIVNGYGSVDHVANGMDCLAAQVIAHFKDGVGGFYLMAPKTKDVGEEYVYVISGKTGDHEATIECFDNVYMRSGTYKLKSMFKAYAAEFRDWAENPERDGE